MQYITTSNLYWDRFELDKLKEMFFTESEIEKCTVTKGDLLVCEGGDIGRAAIWNYDYPMRIQNHIHRLRPYATVDMYFFYFIFNLYKHSGLIGGKGIGIQGLSSNAIDKLLIPLPSLPEQYRIVTKIEELLPFIEKYAQAETQLTTLNTLFPEALKKSILQEAVQGRLVPQDPNDEPASVLLERIRAEKQALVKAGKIKKDKHESVIVTRDKIPYEIIDGKERCIAEEVPFEIPEGWEWTRLGSISSKITDGEHKTPRRIPQYEGYYLLSARNILNGAIQLDDVDYVDKDEYTVISKRCNPKQNDILISCSGSVGRSCVVEDSNNYVMVRSAAMISPIFTSSKWIMFCIQSELIQEQIRSKTKTTAQSNLFQEAIRSLMLPLPPLEEQHRIVTKIEQLLPIINQISK